MAPENLKKKNATAQLLDKKGTPFLEIESILSIRKPRVVHRLRNEIRRHHLPREPPAAQRLLRIRGVSDLAELHEHDTCAVLVHKQMLQRPKLTSTLLTHFFRHFLMEGRVGLRSGVEHVFEHDASRRHLGGGERGVQRGRGGSNRGFGRSRGAGKDGVFAGKTLHQHRALVGTQAEPAVFSFVQLIDRAHRGRRGTETTGPTTESSGTCRPHHRLGRLGHR
mmetsp:Transcript_18634/g.46750  ORF Transcript_18634/g.46750 Transcript_18634/m.46750 type:complete len:222 (-) Transcript_18634:286-951(-)